MKVLADEAITASAADVASKPLHLVVQTASFHDGKGEASAIIREWGNNRPTQGAMIMDFDADSPALAYVFLTNIYVCKRNSLPLIIHVYVPCFIHRYSKKTRQNAGRSLSVR